MLAILKRSLVENILNSEAQRVYAKSHEVRPIIWSTIANDER